MATCTGNGYPFCEDCANQDLEEECEVCDDGDNFDPLHTEDAGRELRRIFTIKEAA